jgi:hypothetical protein
MASFTNTVDSEDTKLAISIPDSEDTPIVHSISDSEDTKDEEDTKDPEEASSSDESTDSKICMCDNCEDYIVYAKHAYYVLKKDEEELCWCQFCFDDLWKEMRDDGWECDDFDHCEEEEEGQYSEDSDSDSD